MTNDNKGLGKAVRPAFALPPAAEGDTTGEFNEVQTGPQRFSDEVSFFEQPGGEGGCAPPDITQELD